MDDNDYDDTDNDEEEEEWRRRLVRGAIRGEGYCECEIKYSPRYQITCLWGLGQGTTNSLATWNQLEY